MFNTFKSKVAALSATAFVAVSNVAMATPAGGRLDALTAAQTEIEGDINTLITFLIGVSIAMLVGFIIYRAVPKKG